jgi:predicted RecA/RadA family phage recombinase
MKNFVQPGDSFTIAAPYAVDAGEGVLVGALFGIAAGDAENGATVDISTVGVFDIAKDASDVFTVGAPVFFDTASLTARSHTDTDSNSAGESEACIGVAIAAAGAGTSTVRVRLGGPVTLA